ncbi:Na+/H+ antiporter subunit E [Shivajiella indica]|uniref:Na+/H+ antiporter subunit E n=1 Tax=Shivajiella indica TaxID=872115 RepID=A0ABW5B551_9BACT
MTKNLLLSNLLLAIIWVMATGTLTEENFIFGFMVSFLILYLITVNKEERKYFTMLPKLIYFILFMLWQIIKANFQAVKESLYTKSKLSPAIVKYPLEASSDVEITLLANLVALTPGTLVIDISDDKKVMYIHVLHLENKESFISEVKNNFEKRLLELMR